MPGTYSRRAALGLAVAALALGSSPIAAQEIDHYGSNRITFEPAGNGAPDDARGKGVIDYRGGDEPDSRWRGSFKFTGLDPNETYAVVVKGRFGKDGSDEADAFTAICSFETAANGKGSCFRYFSGLARLDVLQLRAGDEDGNRVMQANRNGDFGSIETDPSRYSPGGEVSADSAQNQKTKKRGHK